MTFKKIACAIALACCSVASAQTNPITLIDNSDNGDVIAFDTMPSNLASSIAGLSSSDFTNVNSPEKLALALPASFVGDSPLGLGVEINPASYLSPTNTEQTLRHYVRPGAQLGRIARRARITALVKDGVDASDPNDSEGGIIAIGGATSLLDYSDPLMAFNEDLGEGGCYGTLPSVFKQQVQDAQEAQGTKLNFDVEALDLTQIINDLLDGDLNDGTLKLSDNHEIELGTIALKLEVIWLKINNAAASLETTEKFGDAFKAIVETDFDIVEGIDGQPDYDATKTLLLERARLLFNEVEADDGALTQPIEIGETAAKLVLSCREQTNARLRVAANLDVGGALLWRGAPGEFSDFSAAGSALWVSGRRGIWPPCVWSKYGGSCSTENLKRYLVAGASARFGFDEVVSTGATEDTDPSQGEADNWSFWTGVEYHQDKVRLAGRLGYGETDFQTPETEPFSSDGERWLISADYKLFPTVWIGASYGEATGSVDALDGERFLVTVRFSEPDAMNIFGQ